MCVKFLSLNGIMQYCVAVRAQNSGELRAVQAFDKKRQVAEY